MWWSRDPLLEFLGPPYTNIAGQMKPETSNFVQRWMAVSTNEKMQNLFKRGHVVVM